VKKNIPPKFELKPRKIPSQKRAEATLNHILATSALLLEEVGIDKFNTNLLAERAELRIATIYRYFPNKHSILGELVQKVTDLSLESMEVIGGLADPDQDWRKVINDAIDSYVTTARKQPGFVAIRRALFAVPQLRAIEKVHFQKVSALMVTALKERGLQATDEQLYKIANVFMLVGATIFDFAWAKGRKDKIQESKTVDEMRILLTSYLANYMD